MTPPTRLPIPSESRPLREIDLVPLARASFTVSSVAPMNASENIPVIPSVIMELPSDFVFKRWNHLPAVSILPKDSNASEILELSPEFIAFLRFPILLNDYSMIKLIV